jgi:hypothetical protein
VLFLLFGSSASGKSVALTELRRRRVARLAIHDFDEIGVPVEPDRAWRQRANETWLCRALEYRAKGMDVLLAGQTPFGELLATPSAPLLDGISACLLDCDDATRVTRLRMRGEGDLDAYLSWADWMRRHAVDPRWMPEVIATDDGPPSMRWDRWSDWQAGDPRWRVRVVDTSALTVEQVAAELVDWIAEERPSGRKAAATAGGAELCARTGADGVRSPSARRRTAPRRRPRR